MKTRSIWPLIVSAMALAACGGDGDSDQPSASAPPPAPAPAPPPPTFFDANAAYVSLATQPGTWDLKGTGSDGHDHRYILSQTPGENAPFPLNGVVGSTLKKTVQFAEDDDELSDPDLNAATTWFSLGNTVEMGQINYTLGEVDSCYTTTDGQVPPASARVGNQGGLFNYELLGTGALYEGCRKDAGFEEGRTNWSLERIDDTVFFCKHNAGNSISDPTSTYMVEQCFETDENGTIGKKASFDFSSTSGGLTDTLTVRNF